MAGLQVLQCPSHKVSLMHCPSATLPMRAAEKALRLMSAGNVNAAFGRSKLDGGVISDMQSYRD